MQSLGCISEPEGNPETGPQTQFEGGYLFVQRGARMRFSSSPTSLGCLRPSLWCRVEDLESRVRVWSLGFRVQGLGFGV